ncbi:MAG: energy transducer TonB, partial [Balneolaceae bacterium]
GGMQSLYNEINYPDLAKRIGTEGRVYVQFIVNEKGEVENPTIIRGIGAGCDEEVLRAIKLMTFTPGIQNGKFVKVRMQQPVVFKLK